MTGEDQGEERLDGEQRSLRDTARPPSGGDPYGAATVVSEVPEELLAAARRHGINTTAKKLPVVPRPALAPPIVPLDLGEIPSFNDGDDGDGGDDETMMQPLREGMLRARFDVGRPATASAPAITAPKPLFSAHEGQAIPNINEPEEGDVEEDDRTVAAPAAFLDKSPALATPAPPPPPVAQPPLAEPPVAEPPSESVERAIEAAHAAASTTPEADLVARESAAPAEPQSVEAPSAALVEAPALPPRRTFGLGWVLAIAAIAAVVYLVWGRA